MNIKSFLRVALVACLFWIAAGCNGLTPGQPNLYIGYEHNRAVSEIYYVSCVNTGADGHSGKNILSQRKGTFEFNGRQYHMFTVPKRKCDVYFEWYWDDSNGLENERCPINLVDYEWARFDWLEGSTYFPRQGKWPMD